MLYFKNMEIKQKASFESSEVRVYKLDDEYVRYYGNSCYCGEPNYSGNFPQEYVKASELLHASSNNSYIAEVLGDSMIEADIKEGDKVVINLDRAPQDGDVVLAVIDGEITLKFLAHDENGNTWLMPANKNYKPIPFARSYTNEIVGVMVSLIRQRPKFDAILRGRLNEAVKENYRLVRTDEGKASKISKYIPNNQDVKKVMRKLHNILDGQSGIMVVKIMRAAIEAGVLTSMPTIGELSSEFDIQLQSSLFYRYRNRLFTEDELKDYTKLLIS